MKKVAILLPLYHKDSPKFFELSVKSLVSQTYVNIDIYVLVDGKVNNELLSVIKRFPVKPIYHEINRGLACVLNDGLKLVLNANYDYIARMDSDDFSYPERIEKQVSFMENNKHIDCLGTWATEINEKSEVFMIKKVPKTHMECYDFFKKRDCFIHPTVMFRRSFFDKNGFYPEDTYFAEDTLMWANGFKNGCLYANLQEPLLYFRINNDFFKRRHGWKHAFSILSVRIKVNRILNYSYDAYIFAYIYAITKLLPIGMLKFIYKFFR